MFGQPTTDFVKYDLIKYDMYCNVAYYYDQIFLFDFIRISFSPRASLPRVKKCKKKNIQKCVKQQKQNKSTKTQNKDTQQRFPPPSTNTSCAHLNLNTTLQ